MKKAASLRTPCAEGLIPLFCLTKLKRRTLTCSTCFCRLWRTGALPSGQGRTTDFRNCVIIMTSNAGARMLADTKPLGFTLGEAQEDKDRKNKVLAEIKNVFRRNF